MSNTPHNNSSKKPIPPQKQEMQHNQGNIPARTSLFNTGYNTTPSSMMTKSAPTPPNTQVHAIPQNQQQQALPKMALHNSNNLYPRESAILSSFQKALSPGETLNSTVPYRNGVPITPESSNNSPNDTQHMKQGVRVREQSHLSHSVTESPKTDISAGEGDEEGEYICHYCDARFKMRGYLTRHIKKHALRKAYNCPFYNENLPKDDRCHTSGGFSRRDTYKTHMRSHHFTYPPGVRPADRSRYGGECSFCKKQFPNANVWIKDHIEKGRCEYLPQDYLNDVKAQETTSKPKPLNKLKMIKTSTGKSRYISTMESVVEPNVLLNKEALEAMVIVAKNAQRDDVLCKVGDDKLILNSDNFTGHRKAKKKYKPRQPKSPSIAHTGGESLTANSEQMNDEQALNTPLHNYNTTTNSTPNPEYSNITINHSPMHQMHNQQKLPSKINALNQEKITNSLGEYPSLEMGPDSNSHHASPQHIRSPLAQQQYTTPITSFRAKPEENEHQWSMLPLDSEQQSFYTREPQSNSVNQAEDDIAINNTLNSQFVPEKINLTQLEEIKQYLKFYNDFFGADV